MQQKTETLDQIAATEAERQARIDLAAAHRAAVMHGFHEGIFNHLTLTCRANRIATTRSRLGCTGRR